MQEAVGGAIADGATFVYDNAGTISAGAGVAAVALSPVGVVAAGLGGVATVTGVIATGKDAVNGNVGAAALGGAASVFGLRSIYTGIRAGGVSRNLVGLEGFSAARPIPAAVRAGRLRQLQRRGQRHAQHLELPPGDRVRL